MKFRIVVSGMRVHTWDVMPVPFRTMGSIIDEFGELDRQVREFKPVADKHAKLKKVIQAWYEADENDSTHVAEGSLFSVQVSARAHERKITDMLRVYRILKLEAFLE